jgi:hypothetical protein
MENRQGGLKRQKETNLTATKTTPEGSRGHHTAADLEGLPGGTDQPHHHV